MQHDKQSGNAENNPPQKQDRAGKITDENVAAAHEQAEADIEQDADLNSTPDPAADLDEGELAQLDNENDDNPLI